MPIREVKSGDGYLSQRELKLHFGIGKHQIIDKIEGHWVSGTKQTVEGVTANQVLVLKEK